MSIVSINSMSVAPGLHRNMKKERRLASLFMRSICYRILRLVVLNQEYNVLSLLHESMDIKNPLFE